MATAVDRCFGAVDFGAVGFGTVGFGAVGTDAAGLGELDYSDLAGSGE